MSDAWANDAAIRGAATTVGNLELMRRIGRDGHSEIWLARQPALGRLVQVRKLARDIAADERRAERFSALGLAGARLSHPNLVTTHDLFSDRGDLYLVLEHVDGATLAERSAQLGDPPAPVATRIALEVARGLAELHEHGIAHGDLRPESIWLGRFGEVKLGCAVAPSGQPDDDLEAFGVLLAQLARASDGRGLDGLAERCAVEKGRPTARELAEALDALAPSLTPPETRSLVSEWLNARTPARAYDDAELGPLDVPRRRRSWVPAITAGAAAALGAIALIAGVPRGGESVAATEPTPSVDAGQPVAVAAPASASLRVVAFPWAEVQIDDQPVFLTPRAAPLALAPGEHRVHFAHPSLGESELTVKLAPGEARTVRHVFKEGVAK